MKNKHELKEEVLLRLISNPEVMKAVFVASSHSSKEIGTLLNELSFNITQAHFYEK